jgi:hypothetical protein
MRSVPLDIRKASDELGYAPGAISRTLADSSPGSPRRSPRRPRQACRAPWGNPLPLVHLFRCGTKSLAARLGENNWGFLFVSKNRFHAREAAAALLKMARTTSDPAVAAGLVEAAVKLKDEAGELPPPVSVKAPDVQPE